MIDIHCHILPWLDDGASDMDEARYMAAVSADDGVTEIIATPHITWRNDLETDIYTKRIRESADALQSELSSVGIPIVIYGGAEVLCMGELPTKELLSGFPRIEGSDYALVEFCFDETADYMDTWLSLLKEAGIYPIIAHPERYGAVQKDKLLAKKWVESGYILQLNKDSFSGGFGYKAKKAAHRMIKDKLAAFIASDAHNLSSRSPGMSAIYSELSKKYGADYISKIKNRSFQYFISDKL